MHSDISIDILNRENLFQGYMTFKIVLSTKAKVDKFLVFLIKAISKADKYKLNRFYPSLEFSLIIYLLLIYLLLI